MLIIVHYFPFCFSYFLVSFSSPDLIHLLHLCKVFILLFFLFFSLHYLSFTLFLSMFKTFLSFLFGIAQPFSILLFIHFSRRTFIVWIIDLCFMDYQTFCENLYAYPKLFQLLLLYSSILFFPIIFHSYFVSSHSVYPVFFII